MNVHYVSIWKINGANRLPVGVTSLDLVSMHSPNFVASVIADPAPHFVDIDKSMALGTLLLSGLLGQGSEGTAEERLATEIEAVKARRGSQGQEGVFLVFKGETDRVQPDLTKCRHIETFGVCFDAVEKSMIREMFEPLVRAVLTASGLSLPATADRQVERIGEAIYLREAESGKPIYTFSFTAGTARLSIAAPLAAEFATEVAQRAQKIRNDGAFGRPANLLITSLTRETDALQAFIAAWSALEIFVNATFKATYEARWFDIMKRGAPESAKPVFERFRSVMSDKYRLADKFLIIASVLDATAATTDADEFRRLKTVRDNLLHGTETATRLPTDAVQKLILKFMMLHLDCA